MPAVFTELPEPVTPGGVTPCAAVEQVAERRIEFQRLGHGANRLVERVKEKNRGAARGRLRESGELCFYDYSKGAFGAREESRRIEAASHDVA